MSEPNELDCRCMCKDCEERTQETYRLKVSCSNCGWKGVALLRRGDSPSWMQECPHCGRNRLHYGTDPAFDTTAPPDVRQDSLDWCLDELERIRYADGKDWPEVAKARAELAALRSRQPSTAADDYHTMDELYEHRFALTRALVAMMPERCVKCKKNGDGSIWDGFFVVYIDTPAGQVSYHYKLEHWDELPCREVEQWHYDGHTPAITLDRLSSIAARPSPQGSRKCLGNECPDFECEACTEAKERPSTQGEDDGLSILESLVRHHIDTSLPSYSLALNIIIELRARLASAARPSTQGKDDDDAVLELGEPDKIDPMDNPAWMRAEIERLRARLVSADASARELREALLNIERCIDGCGSCYRKDPVREIITKARAAL